MSESEAGHARFQFRLELVVDSKLNSENLAAITEITKGFRLGDSYTIEGPAGLVGPVQATNVTVQQLIAGIDVHKDMIKVAIRSPGEKPWNRKTQVLEYRTFFGVLQCWPSGTSPRSR
jgi:hypothetical protein